MIDSMDTDILTILQENARISNAEIARQVGLAPSAVFGRIRRLEERGVIRGYTPSLDPRTLGLGLTAFVFVKSDEPVRDHSTAESLAALSAVQEVHHIAGEDCYLIKVRVSGTDELARFLRQELGAIPAVRNTRTTIVLQTVKETSRLPIGNASQGSDVAAPATGEPR